MTTTSSHGDILLPGGITTGPRLLKVALVALLTMAIVASTYITQIGPQIIATVQVAILVGIFFAVRKSAWSLVCLGYPLLFGLISAWIGLHEIENYQATGGFVTSLAIGTSGLVLTITGLWKILTKIR